MDTQLNTSTSWPSFVGFTVITDNIEGGNISATFCIVSALLLALLGFGPKVKWRVARRGGSLYPAVNTSAAEYRKNAKKLVTEGRKTYGGRPFIVDTGVVRFIVIDPAYASEIRSNRTLEATKLLQQSYQGKLPGFEPYKSLGSAVLHDIIKHGISKNLDVLGKPMADETASAMDYVLTDNKEWHEINLAESLKDIVTRVSLRVFLGPELCLNDEWIRISRLYQKQSLQSLKYLRSLPRILRPFVVKFGSSFRELRSILGQTRELTDKVLREREATKQTRPGTAYIDALEWGEQLARKRRIASDAAVWQLALSTAALHTSSDLMGQAVLDLCVNRDLIQPLRDEIHRTMGADLKRAGEGGWTKASMQDLKLVDSVLKESQRMKPVSMISMGRWITQDVILNDGTLLPRDNAVAVSCHWMRDPTRYESPDAFDGYRFCTKKDSSVQLVATSPDHLGFGHGIHACPGRYFAAHIAKIIMSHLLVRYDLRLVDGTPVEPLAFGFESYVNPSAKILVRRREDEVEIATNRQEM